MNSLVSRRSAAGGLVERESRGTASLLRGSLQARALLVLEVERLPYRIRRCLWEEARDLGLGQASVDADPGSDSRYAQKWLE